ncbi:MAG: cystathionine beta-synthase [Planctomycetes bacterium]|nr:cystathionine beta-synthase [Planctomycetota bacterium]
MIHDTILDTIGRTPLVRLHHLTAGMKAEFAAKCEFFNPGSSVKDRIAVKMIDVAEREGKLRPGGTIVEPTSGNTGLGLAIAAALKGYKTIFTMPDKMSKEKINLLKAFGSEVVICPTAVAPEDPRSYYSVAKRLSEEIPDAWRPNQYANPNNPLAHYETTGPEIWEQTEGRITHFVVGIGTGGTATGIGKYLKEKNPAVRVIGADPVGSVYLEYFQTKTVPKFFKTYLVEGVGEDLIPETIDFRYIDDVVQATDKECFLTARHLARREGIFTGGSGGLAMAVALKVGKDLPAGSLVVVLVPDTGERYLSKVYNDEWLRVNQIIEPRAIATAKEILAAKSGQPKALVSVTAGTRTSEALELMQKYEVSQLPVFEGKAPIGRVQEDEIIDLLVRGERMDGEVRAVMGPPLPVVSAAADLSQIASFLSTGSPAVLVDQGDGSFGIVTKFDLLDVLRQK